MTISSDSEKRVILTSPNVNSNNGNGNTVKSYPYLPPNHYQKQSQQQKEILGHDEVAEQVADLEFEFSAQPVCLCMENMCVFSVNTQDKMI